ncbi:hypothetical protein ACGVWS_00320 [Enterobacteriaceae bacterium LUAb1]
MTQEKEEIRRLPSGEMARCKTIFKDAIDYSRVNVHRGGDFPFGLQSKNTAVTPNGERWFRPENFLREMVSKHGVIHEMTHVWQYQLGLNVKFSGVVSWAANYGYSLPNHRLFSDYSMEQQASIVADYF